MISMSKKSIDDRVKLWGTGRPMSAVICAATIRRIKHRNEDNRNRMYIAAEVGQPVASMISADQIRQTFECIDRARINGITKLADELAARGYPANITHIGRVVGASYSASTTDWDKGKPRLNHDARGSITITLRALRADKVIHGYARQVGDLLMDYEIIAPDMLKIIVGTEIANTYGKYTLKMYYVAHNNDTEYHAATEACARRVLARKTACMAEEIKKTENKNAIIAACADLVMSRADLNELTGACSSGIDNWIRQVNLPAETQSLPIWAIVGLNKFVRGAAEIDQAIDRLVGSLS